VVIRVALALALLAGGALAAPTPAPGSKPDPVVEEEPAPEPEGAPAPEQPAGFHVTRPPAEMIRENSLLLARAQAARAAARAGNCDVVRALSPKVRALDPTFHTQLFAIDPEIAACLNPGSSSIPADRRRFVLREVRVEPPPSVGRIGGEILLGMVVGTGGALLGALLGKGVCEDCDHWAIGGAYVGAIATIPLGVRTVGNSGDQTGSLAMAYLGAALGGLGGLLMIANGRETTTALGLICAPPLGAVIGWNMTRRYRPRRVPAVGALVHWSDRAGASLGVPIPARARAEDRTVTSVPLLGGTF
jgi:hypothetical protein